MRKQENGFLSLAKKTMAVISASMTALIVNEAKATDLHVVDVPSNNIEELVLKKGLKPQFMLRLNSNLEKSMLFMHRSHSSHSSHRSHSSHSSHYSSSSSYSPPAGTTTPSTYTPPSSSTYTPSTTTTPTATLLSTKRSSIIKSTIKTKSNYAGTDHISLATLENLGYYYRELYKGCEGHDVEYLQQLLVAAGYETPTTGYFGDKTTAAVLKFQKENELKPDGRVGEKTHQAIRDKVDEL